MAMTIEKLESMFRQADFTGGSSFKEELRGKLFGRNSGAKILSMTGALSDDMLDMVSAAGDLHSAGHTGKDPRLPDGIKPK